MTQGIRNLAAVGGFRIFLRWLLNYCDGGESSVLGLRR